MNDNNYRIIIVATTHGTTFLNKYNLLLLLLLLLFCFLGPHLQHMEFPRLVVVIEAAGASLSKTGSECVCGLYHSSLRHQIPDPLRKAKDQTCILMDSSQIISTAPQWEL